MQGAKHKHANVTELRVQLFKNNTKHRWPEHFLRLPKNFVLKSAFTPRVILKQNFLLACIRVTRKSLNGCRSPVLGVNNLQRTRRLEENEVGFICLHHRANICRAIICKSRISIRRRAGHCPHQKWKGMAFLDRLKRFQVCVLTPCFVFNRSSGTYFSMKAIAPSSEYHMPNHPSTTWDFYLLYPQFLGKTKF